VSTNKKIVIRRFDRDAVQGYVNPQSYLQSAGVELLSQSGSLLMVPYEEIKSVHFVRDFGPVEVSPDRRLFSTRPKVTGLWLRMRLRDGEVMDGLLANNLLLVEAEGLTVVPPNPSLNTQRLFVPRAALADVQVLGVVGSRLHPPKPAAAKPKEQGAQIGLFD
jgi:hypothetical protein